MKKAFIKLDELKISYDFHDYKKQGIDKDSVQRWVDSLGIDKVLNKRGTTWRNLSDEQKIAADADVNNAIALLIEYSSMIKRPIIEGSYQDHPILICGFDADEFKTKFQQ